MFPQVPNPDAQSQQATQIIDFISNSPEFNVACLPNQVIKFVRECTDRPVVNQVLGLIAQRVIAEAAIEPGDDVVLLNDNVQGLTATMIEVVGRHDFEGKMLASLYDEQRDAAVLKNKEEKTSLDVTLYDGSLIEVNIPLVQQLLSMGCKVEINTDYDLSGANKGAMSGVPAFLLTLSAIIDMFPNPENLTINIISKFSEGTNNLAMQIPDAITKLRISTIQKPLNVELLAKVPDKLVPLLMQARVIYYEGYPRVSGDPITLENMFQVHVRTKQ